MAENTFRPKNDETNKGKEQSSSMIGKIGKWLTGQKEETQVSTAPSPAPAKESGLQLRAGRRGVKDREAGNARAAGP